MWRVLVVRAVGRVVMRLVGENLLIEHRELHRRRSRKCTAPPKLLAGPTRSGQGKNLVFADEHNKNEKTAGVTSDLVMDVRQAEDVKSDEKGAGDPAYVNSAMQGGTMLLWRWWG